MKKKELHQMIVQLRATVLGLCQDNLELRKDFYELRRDYMRRNRIESDRVFHPIPQFPSKEQDVDYTVTCDSRFTAINSESGSLSSEKKIIVTGDESWGNSIITGEHNVR
jgi:hypothetical protein